MPPGYSSMIKAKDIGFRFGLRKRMVMDALERGIKPTARIYQTTVKTVRKWVKRYKKYGLPGLEEQSRAPKTIPHKTAASIENRVIAKKKELKGYGIGRMVKEFELGCGKEAARRILKEKGLVKAKRKKRQKRNDLREIKAKWRIGQVSCVDTKDLTDIPAYWSQMKRLGLPTWQYSYREVRSGLMLLGYGSERSLAHATAFAEWISAWLGEHGMELKGNSWQTDNGSEFIGSWQSKAKSSFTKALEGHGIAHYQIPKTTYNADVETVHNLVELEFFDIERFSSRKDFFTKISTYQRWFNILRKNSYKANRSPLDIIQEAEPKISSAITSLPALDLDELVRRKVSYLLKSNSFSQRGYYLPGHAPLNYLFD